MTEPFVAVIDGGGSKTAAAIAFEDGRVTVLPVRGGSNPQDNPDWSEVLDAALRPLRGARHTVLGLAGFGEVAGIDAAFGRKVHAVLGDATELMNDVALAARAAFPDGGGVLLLSGTGSMAYAAGPAGTIRTGGWGDLFGDEGSGFWIGRTALTWCSHERDGRIPDSGLADALESRLGIAGSGRFAVLDWALQQRHPRSAIAGLAAIIDTLAETGQPQAVMILEDAAGLLAHMASTAAIQAGLEGPRPWAAAGSVFRSQTLRAAVIRDLGSDPVDPAATALTGGLLLAARNAGWATGADWRNRVATACHPTAG